MAKIRDIQATADTGRVLVDEQLQDLEARLTDLYARTSREAKKDLDAFLGKFAEKDKEKRAQVANGEITQEEYINWRNRKIFRTEAMTAKVNDLTQQMLHADQTAMAMVNEQLPEVYATSWNFAGYRGETFAEAAGFDYTQFTIVNRDAVRILATKDSDLIPWKPEVDIPKDERWNRIHLQTAIFQGIVKGDSIPDISDRLMPVVNMDRTAAVRTARTAVTGVENKGRKDATERVKEAGIPMVEAWSCTHDARTRDTHILMDGTLPNEAGLYGEGIVEGNLLEYPADPRGEPSEVYNCRCAIVSTIKGIDHSKDDELYAAMMEAEYYEDWLDVKEQREEKEAQFQAKRELALEKQGEKEAAFEQKHDIPENLKTMQIVGREQAVSILEGMKDQTEQETWSKAIETTNYVVNSGQGEGENREHYSRGADNVTLFEASTARTLYHETAHAVDDEIIECGFTYYESVQDIETEQFVDREPSTIEMGGASSAVDAIYDETEGAFEIDMTAFKEWVGYDADANIEDPEFMMATLRAYREFEKEYGTSAGASLADMIDALTLGKSPVMVYGGHGSAYWESNARYIFMELWAEVSELEASGQTAALDAIEKILPKRVEIARQVYRIAFKGEKTYEQETVRDLGWRISRQVFTVRRNPSF